MTQEVARDAGSGFLVQLDEGELGRAVDSHEEVELALFGPDFGDVAAPDYVSMWKKPSG